MLRAANQAGQVTLSVMYVVNAFRMVDIIVAAIAIMSLLPFRGVKRLHPLIYPALVVMLLYNIVNLFTEIGRWNAPITWRLPINFISAVISVWFGIVINRIASGKKTKVPFTKRWVIPFHGESIVTDERGQVVYAPVDQTAFKQP